MSKYSDLYEMNFYTRPLWGAFFRRFVIKAVAEAKADAVLAVLDARDIKLSDSSRGGVTECLNLDLLDGWVRGAAIASSEDELFNRCPAPLCHDHSVYDGRIEYHGPHAATLTVPTDEQTDRALQGLTADGRSQSEVVRCAIAQAWEELQDEHTEAPEPNEVRR